MYDFWKLENYTIDKFWETLMIQQGQYILIIDEKGEGNVDFSSIKESLAELSSMGNLSITEVIESKE